MRAKPLSAAELAQIPEFIERWTQIGLSTTPIDREAAEPILHRLYAAAGLAPPQIVWAPCPMTAVLSAIVYTAIRATGREAEARDRGGLANIVDRITRYALITTVPASAHRRIRAHVEDAVAAALACDAGSGFDAVCLINDARRAALDRVLKTSLAPALRKRLRALVIEPVRTGPVRFLRTLVEPARISVYKGVVGLRAGLAGWAHFGAPLWVPYAAQMDYLDRVLGIPLDRSFLDAVEHCGLFWMRNDICFAAERPSYLNRDEEGRLHCEVGPSAAYPSGWSWWHWHGTAVPQQVIEMPPTIAIEDIHRAGDPDMRRIMIERYRTGEEVQGIAAYLRDAGARRLDHDPDFGTLWHLHSAVTGPMLMVEVTNHSPEPDGTYRHFLLRVDPELRPIIGPGSFGQPQERSARNAVAASFGMSGAEYAPEIET
jgi:hypothetical protein